MLRHLFGLSTGFLTGAVTVWNIDDASLWNLREFFKLSDGKNFDYLSIKYDLSKSIDERRQEFKEVLTNQGASARFVEMIGDFHKNLSEYKYRNELDDAEFGVEIDILEDIFRKYYPELFDRRNAQPFISSLGIKLNCQDHYDVPKPLRPS